MVEIARRISVYYFILIMMFLFACSIYAQSQNEYRLSNGLELATKATIKDTGRGHPFGHSCMYAAYPINGVSDDETYGRSLSNPIRVNEGVDNGGSKREQEYFQTLVDDKGRPIAFERLGAIYPPVKSPQLLDVYEITTASGKDTLFIDMYTLEAPQAPTGYRYATWDKADIEQVLESTDPLLRYQYDAIVWNICMDGIAMSNSATKEECLEVGQPLMQWMRKDPRYCLKMGDELSGFSEDISFIVFTKYIALYLDYLHREFPNRVDDEKVVPLLVEQIRLIPEGKSPSPIPLGSATIEGESRFNETVLPVY